MRHAWPCSGSTRRQSAVSVVLLPLPVRPTRPTFSACATSKLTQFNTCAPDNAITLQPSSYEIVNAGQADSALRIT